MRKVLLVILAILISFENNGIISSAERCEQPTISKREINFLNVIDYETDWDKIAFQEKDMDIVRYEALPRLKPNLDNDIKDAAKKYVYAWNNKITLKKALNVADFLIDLVTGLFGIESEKVKNTIENLQDYMKTASELSDEEVKNKLESIQRELKESSSKAAISSSAISLGGAATAIGGGAAEGTMLATKVAAAATTTATTTTVASAIAASPVVMPAVVIGAVGIAGGIGALLLLAKNHNNECEKDETQAKDDLIRSMGKYVRVKDSIFRHDWIDNNILVMASSTVPDCTKVNVQFLDVKGIKYNQDRVNEYVAVSKCQFMEDNTPSCWSKILNEIQCILKGGSRLLCVNDDT